MTSTYPLHIPRYPVGQEDPEIQEILALALDDRTTESIGQRVKRGMDAHDLIQCLHYYRDPTRRHKGDMLALLKAALPFVTPEGLNSTSMGSGPYERGRMAVWVATVDAPDGWGADGTECLERLMEAGAALDGFTQEDERFAAEFLSEKIVAEIRRLGTIQRVERERAVLIAAAKESGAKVQPRAAGRRRL